MGTDGFGHEVIRAHQSAAREGWMLNASIIGVGFAHR